MYICCTAQWQCDVEFCQLRRRVEKCNWFGWNTNRYQAIPWYPVLYIASLQNMTTVDCCMFYNSQSRRKTRLYRMYVISRMPEERKKPMTKVVYDVINWSRLAINEDLRLTNDKQKWENASHVADNLLEDGTWPILQLPPCIRAPAYFLQVHGFVLVASI